MVLSALICVVQSFCELLLDIVGDEAREAYYVDVCMNCW